MKTPARSAIAGADIQQWLDAASIKPRLIRCNRSSIVYTQGAPASAVFYIRSGSVKLSVVSSTGKEAVVAMLGPGDFFGEGCLAGQTVRMSTATAIIASRVLTIDRRRMRQLLRRHPTLSQRFISYILAKNIRVEEDLIDRLFNSVEKRFARALMLMARYGRAEGGAWILPKVSQETIAEM